MNPVRARLLEEQLRGNQVGDFTVRDLLGTGKTAAVFSAERAGTLYALKLFDKEFIEEVGLDGQLERIRRQLVLVNHPHETIVRVFDGGFDHNSGFLFLSMEHLTAPSLSQQLDIVPPEAINALVLQLVAAARHLEELELAHRDIKPDNIALIVELRKIKLLDFGVIRPFGEPASTDDGGILRFIGTLQYSSPEFLLRKEKQCMMGWRAVTIYQIGAVMHDLIMRRPIFSEDQYPFARLTNAVQHKMPEIINDSIDPAVITLALSCLVKDPDERLSLVDWDLFERILSPRGNRVSSRERVLARSRLNRTTGAGAEPEVESEESFHRKICPTLWAFLRGRVQALRTEIPDFPPVKSVSDDRNGVLKFEISMSREFGLGKPLSVFIKLSSAEPRSAVIRMTSRGYLGIPKSVPFDNAELLYHGPYQENLVGEVFEERLFAYIDSAYQANAVDDLQELRIAVGAEE
jgi:eukaryotic-like serine/threonine-protein kinase